MSDRIPLTEDDFSNLTEQVLISTKNPKKLQQQIINDNVKVPKLEAEINHLTLSFTE